MSAYHQMGNDSESMVVESGLSRFAGAILSPVNYGKNSTVAQCKRFREYRENFDIIFDPQIYVPDSKRGKLPEWKYFPDDYLTADKSSLIWWEKLVEKMITETAQFQPNAICSPAFVPRAFDDDYYDLLVKIGNHLQQKLNKTYTRGMLTAVVSLDDLGRNQRHLAVASILSGFLGKHIYIVFADRQPPRNERTDSGGLEGAIRLIGLLVDAGIEVTVGFTSSELLLWKYAGAQHVASGKFFNLRRFTLERWDTDEKKGGQQLWYWFEPAFLTFMREADLRRVQREGLQLDAVHTENPYSQTMLKKLAQSTPEKMLADSWRQFLFWFAYIEEALENKTVSSPQLIAHAQSMWIKLSQAKLQFEEERNSGEWVRSWSIAIAEVARRVN